MKNRTRLAIALGMICCFASSAGAGSLVGGDAPLQVNDPQFVNSSGKVTRAQTTDGGDLRVAPSPPVAGHPWKLTLPGGSGVCQQVGSGDYRFTCSVDCQYEGAQYLPDAGYLVVVEADGGVVTTATADSNDLSAATPEALTLTVPYDSVCVYSAIAGNAKPAPRRK